MKSENDLSVLATPEYRRFIEELKVRVVSARISAARSVNCDLILLYWDIGRGIVEKQRVLGWGDSVVEMVAADLRRAFPDSRSFSSDNLWRMRQFHIAYSDATFLGHAVPEITPAKSESGQPAILGQAVPEIGPAGIALASGATSPALELLAAVPWGQNLLILKKLPDPAARLYYLRAVDSGLLTLYWHVGRRIRKDILKEKRAEYGERIVSALGRQLAAEFGRGLGTRNLFRMIRFAEVFPDFEIVSALRTQLGWTHFRQVIAFDDPLKRDFYAEMCRIEQWNTRTLEKKIGSMLFERTALSKKPDQLIRQELDALRAEDKLTPDLVFRDPYVLDFLRLHDSYAEQDIEAAILREMESFILELGVGFCFVARQKRSMMPCGSPGRGWRPGGLTMAKAKQASELVFQKHIATYLKQNRITFRPHFYFGAAAPGLHSRFAGWPTGCTVNRQLPWTPSRPLLDRAKTPAERERVEKFLTVHGQGKDGYEAEARKLETTRYRAGMPRSNDGALLFLQTMLAKKIPFGVPPSGGSGGPAKAGTPNEGSRIAIIFNGSPLSNGDCGSWESEIRRWILEGDWLDAIVMLPDQLPDNTGRLHLEPSEEIGRLKTAGGSRPTMLSQSLENLL